MGNFTIFKSLFGITQKESSVGVEIMAGITTFLTMSYIVFLQPAIMSGQLTGSLTGMDFSALIASTCIVAAFVTMLIFMSGLAVGILSFVRILEWFFRKFHDITIAVLAGFVLGSLN